MGDNQSHSASIDSIRGKSPALLALVEPKWLEQAGDEFQGGKQEIYFRTDAQIGQAARLPIQNVYFKVTGTTAVVAKAKFTTVASVNPREKRLSGHHDDEGRFYYGFRDLISLAQLIPLSSLRFFTTGAPVPNDLPGACIIEEIPDEDRDPLSKIQFPQI